MKLIDGNTVKGDHVMVISSRSRPNGILRSTRTRRREQDVFYSHFSFSVRRIPRS